MAAGQSWGLFPAVFLFFLSTSSSEGKCMYVCMYVYVYVYVYVCLCWGLTRFRISRGDHYVHTYMMFICKGIWFEPRSITCLSSVRIVRVRVVFKKTVQLNVFSTEESLSEDGMMPLVVVFIGV